MKSSAPSIGREARNCPNQVTLSITRESSAGRNDLLHYLAKLPQKDGQTLKLYFIREEEQLTSLDESSVEVVQMALNLWGKTMTKSVSMP